MTDLLVLWAWEHDTDFIALLQKACVLRGVRVRLVGEDELPTLTARLESGALTARCVLDRVWDWGGDYERHVSAVQKLTGCVVNPYELVRRAWHKPDIHFRLIANGLNAPYLSIVPSVNAVHEPTPIDLTPMRGRFSIKSAHSGGSGVIKPATHWREVLEKRHEWPSDDTLVQAWVQPQKLRLGQTERPAWFRIFFACGSTFLCWQNDQTHLQTPVTHDEEDRYNLHVLRGMVQQIANICGLNLFSTEIALDADGVWQVVDYVNDPCDFRLKSKAHEGVPDEVVAGICDRVASWVKRQTLTRLER
jgi:hypothetical protein